MKAPNQPYGYSVGEKTSLSTFNNYIRNYIYQPLAKYINSISFGSVDNTGNNQDAGNIDGQWVVVNFISANTDTAVTHNLNRIPSGYLIMAANAATSIYTGDSTWTSSTIYLRSSTANVNVKLLLV